MHKDDQDVPVYRVSGLEEREALLAQAMAHAEVQEAQYKVLPADEPRYGRWKSPLALLIFLVAGLIALFPPHWLAGSMPTVQTGDLERGLRAAVYLQAQEVEVYRVRHGSLPDDLTALPTYVPGLRLVKSNNRVYQILGRRPGGDMLVYDSAHPGAGFASVASGWTDQEAP